MKSIEEITNQKSIFMHDWSNKFDVVADFEDVYMTLDEYEAEETPYPNESAWLANKEKMSKALEKYKEVNILFASYGNENYSGDAWVLYEYKGELYEVSGGHCSCYGLEGQWEREKVVLKELEHRLLNGTFGEDDWSGNSFKQDLCDFLGVEYITNR